MFAKYSVALAASATLSIGLSAQPASADTFVHLFEWQWEDVAQECENWLGPKGFKAVQVSPPQEHIQGDAWWTRYQPVSYQLESRSGSSEAFADMVQRCNAAGVDVYADAVINHVAHGKGQGIAGSSYDSEALSYPHYQRDDFHEPCGIEQSDYTQNAESVRQCQLVGLPDLNTSDPTVQSRIADYLDTLAALGVRGIRIDAAKHMAPNDIAEILAQVDAPLYAFQEVIDLGGEAISATEYQGMGDITEFRYGASLGDIFNNQALANLQQFGESPALLPSEQAVVFTDNHDNQRGHGAGGSNILTHRDDALYRLANMFMLAWPYGYPKVMSSYAFSNSDQGPPQAPVYQQGEAQCGEAWVCEHRWPEIANMVAFRQQADGAEVTHWWDNGHHQIAFSREAQGFIAINREQQALTHTFQTDMADGSYQNVTAEEQCITVENGQLTLNIPAMSAAALHVGAPCLAS